MLIVLYLEEEEAGLSLDGNSWLDDDDKWKALIEGEDMEKLEKKLETILNR